jgi:hypothetical protein
MAQSTNYENIVEAAKTPSNKAEERKYAVWKGVGENVAPLLELPVIASSSIFNVDTLTISNAIIKSTTAALICGTVAFIATGGIASVVIGGAFLGSTAAGIEGALEVKRINDENEKNNPPSPFSQEQRQAQINELTAHGVHKSDVEKIIKTPDNGKPKNELKEVANTVFVGAVAPTATLIGGICFATVGVCYAAANAAYHGAKKILGTNEKDITSSSAEPENPAKSNLTVQGILTAKDNIAPQSMQR